MGACSKYTAVEIQDAYVRYVPAEAFRGMKALTNVNLGVVGIEALVEASFAADLLPGLERMQMIISSELVLVQWHVCQTYHKRCALTSASVCLLDALRNQLVLIS